MALSPNQPFNLGSQRHAACNTFGLHHKLTNLKQTYEDGDMSLFANVGTLIEPLTREEFRSKSKRIPPNLGSHSPDEDGTKCPCWIPVQGYPRAHGRRSHGAGRRLQVGILQHCRQSKSSARVQGPDLCAPPSRNCPQPVRSDCTALSEHQCLEPESIYDTWADVAAATLISSRTIARRTLQEHHGDLLSPAPAL